MLKTIYEKQGIIKRKFKYDKCIHDDKQGWSTFTFEDEEQVRERWLYPILAEHIDQGKIFVDIGAACGSYCLPALAFGWKVLAFAPQADADCLIANLHMNNWFGDNIENRVGIVRGGLYDRSGYLNTQTLDFRAFHSSDFYSQTNLWKNKKNNVHEIEIPVIPFDEFIYSTTTFEYPVRGDYAFIKIDVEGAELEVLKGAKHMINTYKPHYILVENHEFKIHDIGDKVIEFMKQNCPDYTVKGPIEYHSISHTFFKNKSS